MSETESSISRRDFALCASGLLALLGATGADAVANREFRDPVAEEAAAARLKSIPDQIGAWTSTPESLNEFENQREKIAGIVRRTYRNRESGFVATLTILCGAAGPMSVHPPTACYESVGYELSSGPTVVAFADEGTQTALNRATFRIPGSPLSDVVRVFWGWGDNGIWTAPANPRLAFRGQPCLYKLYVVDRSPSPAEETPQSETFLEDALPEIRRRLQQQ